MLNSNIKYKGTELYIEEIKAEEIYQKYGSPTYIYSRKQIEHNFSIYKKSFSKYKGLICYAVKANSNIAILNILAKMGAGFDIVSVGELERVLAANGDPKKVVFAGVGKTKVEIKRALEVGIKAFNVESISELKAISEVAQSIGVVAPVSIRTNPNVDAKTHPYISTGMRKNKFGIESELVVEIYKQISTNKNLRIVGIDCHIGSQISSMQPFLDALDNIIELYDTLLEQGIKIQHIDLGGGIGVKYTDESTITIPNFIATVEERLAGRELEIILEPGRSILADAGILLTKVEYIKSNKHKNFAIIDAAMNDLMRPALYQAIHEIVPTSNTSKNNQKVFDVVGPVCESGDYLAKDITLDIQEKDLLAILTCGAYAFSMSSNYNTRPKAAEVIVFNDSDHLVCKRQTIESLFSNEQLLP